MGIEKIGAPRLMARNIIPALRPLFSTFVQSANEANSAGIPKPNENPKKKLTMELVTPMPLNQTSSNELNIPKSTQRQKKRRVLSLFDKIEPKIPDPTIAT